MLKLGVTFIFGLAGVALSIAGLIALCLLWQDDESVRKLLALVKPVGSLAGTGGVLILGSCVVVHSLTAMQDPAGEPKEPVFQHDHLIRGDKVRTGPRLLRAARAHLMRLAPNIRTWEMLDGICCRRLGRTFARIVWQPDDESLRIYLDLNPQDETSALRCRSSRVLASDMPEWGNVMLWIQEKQDLRQLNGWMQKSCARLRR